VTIRNSMLAVTAALAISVAGAACDRSANDARDEAAELQQKADRAATEAQQKAREASQDAMRTANEGASRTGAAAETFDVKTALMADKTVDASDINVDTIRETRVVVLRGTVPNPAQKELAGDIAAREAEGYRVDNQLTVKAKR
jgi:osmotically-inducible protein OsmY